MIGIYKITSPTGKIYIGSSINIKNRIKHYKNKSCIGQKRLYNSILKYGFSSHIFEIIETCTAEELYLKENYYGNLYNVLGVNGLNCVLPKFNDSKKQVSEETLKKMSNSKIGDKNTFFGKTHSEEARKKIRESQLGRKHSEEHRQKVSINHAKHKSKIVLDLNTGVFYNSAKEISELFKINYSTIRAFLNGTNKNKTSFIYC